jgi:transcriptional regulator
LLGEDDPPARRRVLERTAAEFEGRLPEPWDAGLHPELVTRLAPQVVALEVRVSSLEGRWKLGQDKPDADRSKVIAHLEALGGEAAVVGRLMAEHAPRASGAATGEAAP